FIEEARSKPHCRGAGENSVGQRRHESLREESRFQSTSPQKGNTKKNKIKSDPPVPGCPDHPIPSPTSSLPAVPCPGRPWSRSLLSIHPRSACPWRCVHTRSRPLCTPQSV